jgi:predicted phage terminase large subunit-like protein
MAEAEKEFAETGVWPADADRWEVVSYPAIATEDERYRKKGEALHPERYSLGALLKIRRTMVPRDWAALYQQSPVVEEGAYFEKRMLRYYEGAAPEHLEIVAAGDLAISKRDEANYTVLSVAGLAEGENIYMLDERRGHWNADEIVEQIIDVLRVWKPRRFGLEKGQILLAIGPHLDRRLREEKLPNIIEELPPTNKGDKQARARPFQGRMARGQVYFPKEALWTDAHINELLRFPNGVNDDRVDADAWIGQMLAYVTYQGPRKEPRAPSWRKRLAGYASEGSTATNYMAA